MRGPSRTLAVVLTVVTLGVLAAGAWLYRSDERRFRRGVEASLDAIAQLKVTQIADWRGERLADAADFAEATSLTEDAANWLSGRRPGSDVSLLSRFRSLQMRGKCTDVMLLDPQGSLRLSLSGRPYRLNEAASQAFQAAMRERAPALTDIYRDRDGAPIVATFAPLTGNATRGAVVGAVALLRDVRQFLYPLLQSWPVPTRTAESLLVRRDGDSALFLNELRQRPNSALELRIPLTRREVPAVRAVLGEGGVINGKDYGGVDVLAATRPVPGTAWYLVAKIDDAEAFAPWRETSGLILILITACLAAGAALFGVIWQRRNTAHFRELYQAEAARGEGEARYATTLMSIGDAVITTDRAGIVTLLNPIAESLTGVRSAEAVGRPLDEVFHIINEDTRQAVMSPIFSVLDRGVIVGLANHTVLISRSGEEYPIADSAAPIRGASGELVGVALVFRDQTEERKAQRAIRESEQRYRGLFEHMLEGFAYCRMIYEGDKPIDFIYLGVNDSFERLTGLRNVVGKRVTEVIPGIRETDRELFEIYGRVARTGHPEKVERLIHALGMWFSISIYSPEPDHFVAVFDVVTARKLTEQALRESELRYRHLVDILPEAVVVHRDGLITYANPAAVQLFGADQPQQLIGQAMIDRVHPDFRESVRSRVRVITTAQQPVPIVQERLLRLDGSGFDAEVAAMPLVTHGRSEVLAIARDLTEQQKAEAEKEKLRSQLLQSQKMEAVGRLAGGVAHDFNNMLTVIQGYSDSILGRLEPDDPIRGDMLEVQAAAGRSANLTRQLLAFSRRQTIAPRVVDLNAQLSGMNRLLGRILGEDISLRFTLAPDLWPVYLDLSQVDQIVANLAVNSRDAMPDGGALTVQTANETVSEAYQMTHPWIAPGGYVKLSISDTGVGMDKETLAHVFEPFFTTKAEGQGTGLGLATVFGIVKQNHGAIDAYSEPGHGTIISIYFPRHLHEGVAPTPPDQAQKPRGGGETILLVEDEAQLRRLAKAILERLGYHVLEAGDPDDALAISGAHQGTIELLLTDVVMPRMNGRDLDARIRASRPGVKSLFMSGYTADTIAPRGVLDAGIEFLQKPFAAATLAAKVREVLDRR